MELTIMKPCREARNGMLVIDDARILFRNFTGKEQKFNREGERNFSLIIDSEEIAEELISDGWNVRIKASREEGDTPFMHLKVKVKFNDYGPRIYLRSGNSRITLDEDTVGRLDAIDISRIDMDISPNIWEDDNGEEHKTAYLRSMEVTQELDRFTARYMEETSTDMFDNAF